MVCPYLQRYSSPLKAAAWSMEHGASIYLQGNSPNGRDTDTVALYCMTLPCTLLSFFACEQVSTGGTVSGMEAALSRHRISPSFVCSFLSIRQSRPRRRSFVFVVQQNPAAEKRKHFVSRHDHHLQYSTVHPFQTIRDNLPLPTKVESFFSFMDFRSQTFTFTSTLVLSFNSFSGPGN